MRVEIGPVSGDSAVVWIRYGRGVVRHLSGADASPMTANVLERFTELLDEFERIAVAGHTFHWSGERSPEEVEFLMKGLYEIGLAVEREHELGHMELRPAEADEFHVTAVRQILSEVEQEGPTSAQFVDGLRSDWGVAGES
ncbi:MAG: hypothetical protein U0Q22_09080 [Acidimicrobiales bacterium]